MGYSLGARRRRNSLYAKRRGYLFGFVLAALSKGVGEKYRKGVVPKAVTEVTLCPLCACCPSLL